MIHLLLTRNDLLNLRFSYSPLFELLTSYRMQHYCECTPNYDVWLNETYRALHDVDLPYMESLLAYPSYIPDFLTPTPHKSNITLEEELATILATPPKMMESDILFLIDEAGTSTIREFMLTYPHEALLCLIDEMRLYWKRVLEPQWSQITHILEGDMLHHGRVMALEGAQVMLSNLTTGATFCTDTHAIQINKRDTDHFYHLDGQGLQLLAGMFTVPEHVMWMINPRYRPLMLYSARGAGMWKQSLPESNPSLELALGAGRARVLIALAKPRNTGELAQVLNVSSGAVSQHLSRLAQAGLVNSRRVGKRVFYHLTDRGENLITLFNTIS